MSEYDKPFNEKSRADAHDIKATEDALKAKTGYSAENIRDVISGTPGHPKEQFLNEFAKKLSERFPNGTNTQTVSDKNPNETQKNSAGDAINPETGLPKINWNAHKKFRP